MSYIVKRSDGAVWAKSPDHPGYFWYKDREPVVYEKEQTAQMVRRHVLRFQIPKGETVTVEKYP